MSNNLVAVKLIKGFKGYNAGEVAGFPRPIAAKMIATGVAKAYKKGMEDEIQEVEDDIPQALVMMSISDLMDKTIEEVKKELELTSTTGIRLYGVDYLSEALDYESLNKARDGMMEYLMEETEKLSEN